MGITAVGRTIEDTSVGSARAPGGTMVVPGWTKLRDVDGPGLRPSVAGTAAVWPVLAAALIMASCACTALNSTTPPALPAEGGPDAASSPKGGQLGPEDVFEVRVYGEKELSGVYRVANDGTIDFPLLGRVIVGGLDATSLTGHLTERLRRFVRRPHVSVFVQVHNSQKIFVFGKVQKPGTFQFGQGMTIVQAITLAGGFDTTADENGTYVTRSIDGKEHRIRVPVEDIGQGKVANLSLLPGDIVYVPETIF